MALATPGPKMNLWDLLMQGGVLMVPAGIVAGSGSILFFERWIAIRHASKMDENFEHYQGPYRYGKCDGRQVAFKKYSQSCCKDDRQGHSAH